MVGEIARSSDLKVRELSTHHESLEQRYMELTSEAVDFHTDIAGSPAPAAT
jgi:ABC-2 type transport system ATP-binding protein